MSSDEHDEKMRDLDEDEEKVNIVMRTIVTGPEAGSIIGRKGETVKNIREESKAKIKIEGDGPHERIITVDGKTDSIFKAYTMICKVLEQREKKEDRDRSRSRSPGSEDLCLKILVPSSQCGALIGKGGEQIKGMRSSTGADINICSDPLAGSTEREVKVVGKRDQITKCIYEVCVILLENPPKGDVRLYRPDSGGGGGGGRGGDRERERDRDRSFRGDRGGGDRDFERGRGGGRRDDDMPRFGANPFDAIVDFARRHEPPRGGGGRDRETKHEMYVSNEQIGAVIGRKGSKINEIRQMSGASINILEAGSASKKDRREFNPDVERERIIEISGSPEQVAIAKSLINVAVELAEGAGDRRDNRRHDRDRSRSRSRDRGGRYDDRRRW